MYNRVEVREEVLSDLETQFTSNCTKEVSRLLSIRQLTTSPYHPACSGLVEKFNGVNPLLFAYREARQEATGFSPFDLLYGRTVKGPVQIPKEQWSKEENVPEVTTNYQYVLEQRERLNETMKLTQAELERNQIRNKNCIIGRRRKEYFKRETKFWCYFRLTVTSYWCSGKAHLKRGVKEEIITKVKSI